MATVEAPQGNTYRMTHSVIYLKGLGRVSLGDLTGEIKKTSMLRVSKGAYEGEVNVNEYIHG